MLRKIHYIEGMKLSQEKRIYCFAFFYMFLVLIPVIVPFFQGHGLSMEKIFQLQAIFGIGVVIFEVPTGYLADIFGRKKTLVLGGVSSVIGFSGLAAGSEFWHFAVAEFVLSLGAAFVSGSDSAMLYESLPKDDRKRTANAFANLQLSQQLGESTASLLGGFLATLGMIYAAWAQVGAAVLVVLVSLGLKEEKRDVSRQHGQNFQKVFREVFFGDKILRLTFLNSVVWGLATFFAVWTYQKHWQELGVGLAYFGILWAIYNLSAGIAGKFSHSLEHRWGAKKILLIMALLSSLSYFGLALAPGLWAIAFGLGHYVSRGINGVIMNDALNWRLSSEFRATANSLKSFAFRLGFAILGPGVGYLIDQYSLTTAYLILGTAFLMAIPVVLFPLIKKIEESGKKEVPY